MDASLGIRRGNATRFCKSSLVFDALCHRQYRPPAVFRTRWSCRFLSLRRSFEAPLEFVYHTRDVTPHRGARSRCIVGGNRLDDGGVIANGLSRQVGGMKVLLHSSPQLGALRPQTFDHQLERTITGSLGQSQMKIAIAVLADAEIVDVGLHAPDSLSQAFDIVVAGIRGRQRRNFTLDQLTRAQELERTRANVAIPRARRSRGRGHEDAGSDAHLDQPTDFERNDGLAHRRATHAKLGRQLALGREARSRLELSSGDKTRDLVPSGKVQPIVYRDCGAKRIALNPS